MKRNLTDIEKNIVQNEKVRLAARNTDNFKFVNWKLAIQELEDGRVLKVKENNIIAYRKISILDSPMNWIECKFDIENLSIEQMIIIDDLWYHFRWYSIPKY